MSETRMGGPAKVDPTCFIAPGAVVVGDITLAARASVWFNTVVRGDSAEVRVGEDTNLQDNGVVHEDEGFPTLIGARVTVGHRAIVHGCVIEDDCLIGMGAIVLSGARIGTGSLIGAGALVREGQVVPPGSLAVGAPARVMGPVSDAHRTSIRNGWSHYAELAALYLKSGCGRSLDRSGAAVFGRPPMDEREWWDSLRVLREFPDRLGAGMLAPGPDSALATEVVGLLAGRDRFRRQPMLASLAAHDRAAIDLRAEQSAPDASGQELHRQWMKTREALCAMLESLGPAIGRRAEHPTRGSFTLPELVREWIDEDFEQYRRLTTVGGPPP